MPWLFAPLASQLFSILFWVVMTETMWLWIQHFSSFISLWLLIMETTSTIKLMRIEIMQPASIEPKRGYLSLHTCCLNSDFLLLFLPKLHEVPISFIYFDSGTDSDLFGNKIVGALKPFYPILPDWSVKQFQSKMNINVLMAMQTESTYFVFCYTINFLMAISVWNERSILWI
jgi:hypothetical protein